MLFETSRQAPLFLLFFCCGTVQGVFYALLYTLRRKGRPVFTITADILFALFFFASSACTLYAGKGGVFRLYQAAALLIGNGAAHFSLGFFLKKVIDFWTRIRYNVYEYCKQKTRKEGRVEDGGKAN